MLAAPLTLKGGLRSVVTRRPRRLPGLRFHAGLEVVPAFLRNLDLGRGQLAGLLREDVQQDNKAPRPPVEHSEELRAHMAAQLAQLPRDLRAMRKGKVWHRLRQTVEAVDLTEERSARLRVEVGNELEDWLRPVSGAVVDRLEVAHAATADAGAAVDASRSAAESFSAASTCGT